MIKRITVLLSVSLVLLLAICGCSSNKNDVTPEGLDLAIAQKMRADFQEFLIARFGEQYSDEFTLDSIWVQQYFGNFYSYEVVYMGSDFQHTQEIRPVEIAGYTIVFPSSQEAYVYKDSMFYTIGEAYAEGFISQTDVYEIGKQVGIDFDSINS